MKFSSIRLIVPFLLVAMLPLCLSAGPVEEATQRMKERVSQIDSMKTSGNVGENADGFLEARSAVGPRERSIIDAENADRLLVYTELSKRVGQSVKSIGQQRAIRIAELSRSGVWVEKPDGTWQQKR